MIHELQAEDVRAATVKVLSEHIPLATEGYVVKSEMMWHVLLKAAVENGSIESASLDLEGVAHGNTLREQLNERFRVTELMEQELAQNRVLAATLPRELWGRAVDVAIDFHDEPFYGKTAESRQYVCRGAAKAGTTHFWRIATAYVMWGDLRLTIGITYVLPEHSTLDVLQRLLHRVEQHQIVIKVLYLDKEFCQTDVIQWLQDRQQAAILACPIRGKQQGTRVLCRGRKSYRTTYTFGNGTTVEVAVVATQPPDSQGQRCRKWLLFVVIGLDWTPKKIKKRYRRRFGIESSYRQLRRLRIFTTGLNPAWRFFALGLSLLLVNIWLWLRWHFTRLLKPGPYRVEAKVFRLHRFVQFLRRAIEDFCQVVMSIPTHLPPRIVIY
jgi:putative transposase